MKIFDKRPLSLIIAVMLGSFVFFSLYDTLVPRIIIISIIVLSFVFSFIKIESLHINRLMLRLSAVFAAIAVILSFLYFDMWFKAYDRYDGEVTISGTVENINYTTYKTAIYLKSDNINNTPLSSYELIVYVDKSEYYGFSIGTRISVSGVIENFTSSEAFDIKSYYTSRGISGAVNEVTEFNITDNGDYPISYKINSLRLRLCRRIIYNSNSEVGGLLCALLLGEKEYLPKGTQLDFSRIGISHILALSGMHLAILAIGFSKLLMKFGINKKRSTFATVIFTLLYMTITGFSVSVTRAGIMLIISSILFLLSETKDSMTSLFVSVAVICILTPYAIYDTALWLSALATLGIIVFGEGNFLPQAFPAFPKWVLTSFLSSFFAISATFAITAVKFDGISIIAPVSTIVFSILTEVFLYIGILLILFCRIIPIKYAIIVIGYAIIDLAEWLSDFDFIYSSTNFTVIEISSVIFGILFFAFFVFNIKHKKTALSFLAVILVCIFTLSSLMTYNEEHETNMVYFQNGSEQILIKNSGEICLIDISAYKSNSAHSVYSLISSNGITKIDKYIMTHYSYYSEDAIDTLIGSVSVKEIYIPAPQNAEENAIHRALMYAFEDAVTIIDYNVEDAITIGSFVFMPLYSSELSSDKKIMFTIFYNSAFYTYLTVDMLSGDTKSKALEVIDGSSTIIFGCYESKTSEYKFTYMLKSVRSLIVATDRIYMHNDTYDYYSDKNVYIYPNELSLIH